MDEKKFAIKETVSAEEVKMLRKKLGLTQRDFAGLLGCSKPTVERLEREGTVTKGPMALLMKLLDRDAEYIQTLMIPPRELPVRIWYMYKDTPCTLIDVDGFCIVSSDGYSVYEKCGWNAKNCSHS